MYPNPCLSFFLIFRILSYYYFNNHLYLLYVSVDADG